MRVRTLSREIVVPARLEEVFEFFSNAENLEKLTPASLRFEILTPIPIDMKPGALIEYRLRLIGVPFRWLTEITAWEPGVRFVDVQRAGPYLLWEHEHFFEAIEGGTVIRDCLRFAVPGGLIEPLITHLFVRRQVERIFDYRERQVLAILGG
ncbi:MAG: SRPBCC family protein [Armatimonadetes bacterium]|nr:SRPBCC family protein [Armatimonadota bacterium]